MPRARRYCYYYYCVCIKRRRRRRGGEGVGAEKINGPDRFDCRSDDGAVTTRRSEDGRSWKTHTKKKGKKRVILLLFIIIIVVIIAVIAVYVHVVYVLVVKYNILPCGEQGLCVYSITNSWRARGHVTENRERANTTEI